MAAYIYGIGMLTPVGLNTVQTCAAVRAGISGYAQSSVMNKESDPMTLALVPEDALHGLDDADAVGLTARKRRMLQLAIPALGEALESLPEQPDIPLFLAVPEGPREDPDIVYDDFLDRLVSGSGASICPNTSEIIAGGRATGMDAVRRAIDYLSAGQGEFVLVGGVDSHLDLRLLSILDRDDRVLADGVMDGFVPGEGAGFLLLRSDSALSDEDEPRVVRLHRPGISEEPGHRFSDTACTGDGLTGAIREALSDIQGELVKSVFTNLNGESDGAKEWGIAFSRHAKALDSNVKIYHPAENFGDTDTASALVLLGLGSTLLFQERVSGNVLVGCSSEAGLRGAACLTLHH